MKRETSESAAPKSFQATGGWHVDALETMTDGFVSLDKDWCYTYVNRRAAEMFGRKAEDLIGKHIWTEFPEGVGQKFYYNYYKVLETQQPINMEEYYPPWNRWFENRIQPTRDGISIFFQDITDRKRIEQLADGQNRLLEMVASGRPYQETLLALVHFIESQAREMLCSILVLDEDGMHIRHGAAPNLPREFVAAIDGSAIGPSAGSCGTAAFRGEPVFVEDIETDPLWNDYRYLSHPHGFRACWSTPIFDEAHKVLGTFAMYYNKPALPEPFHLQLIDVATHIASICITRNRDEEILRRSEQRLGLIYDTVADIIFLLHVQPDEKYTFASVNHAFLIATGLTSSDIIGKDVKEVIPAASHELVFGNYRKAIQEKRPVQWEEISEFPAGKRTAIVKVNPVFDDRGNCTNLVGAVHDITEFREAEEAVRKSEEELEHVYKTAPVGLALLDEQLRFIRVNEELAAINGMPVAEHIGKTIREIVAPLPVEVEAALYRVLQSGEEVRDLEVHGPKPADPDQERDWLASFYPVRANAGSVSGVALVVLDITDRSAITRFGQTAIGYTDIEELFRIAQEIVAKTLNVDFVAVFELMSDGQTLTPRANLGWTVPLPVLKIGEESQAGFTLLTRQPVIVDDMNKENRFRLPNHLVQQKIISSMTVMILGKNTPYGVLGAYSDERRDFSPAETHFLQSAANILGAVMERKALEQQIFQAQKMELIGGLAAGVAHQLNTPLAVIMMRLQMLKEDITSIATEESMSQLQTVMSSARKMSTIIQDLLNFSRVSKFKKEPVRIEPLLKQILDFIEVRARKQGVEIRQDFALESLSLHADKNQMEQALLNIIVNALDAMPNGGILKVSTTQTRIGQLNYARIFFQDTGSGLSPDVATKIFDPFFTTKPVGHGTGLGLSVTHEIIKGHGGEIRVSSENNKGSVFEVLLPLQVS